MRLSDGRVLGFAEYGDSEGKPLFFFHGWPNSRLYAEVLDKTAKKLHVRVISPDRPGYGLSDYKNGRTFIDWPKDVEELAEYLHIKKFALIGNSGGGPYALSCAYKIPNRVTKVGVVVGVAQTNIEGILHGMPYLNRVGWRYYQRFPLLIKFVTLLLNIKATLLSRTILFDFNSISDKELLRTLSKEALGRRRREAFKQGIKGPALDLHLYTHDWAFSLEDIQPKVFLWYGEKDKKVSTAMGRYLETKIPKSRLHIYKNEGHMILNSHTEEILSTLFS